MPGRGPHPSGNDAHSCLRSNPALLRRAVQGLGKDLGKSFACYDADTLSQHQRDLLPLLVPRHFRRAIWYACKQVTLNPEPPPLTDAIGSSKTGAARITAAILEPQPDLTPWMNLTHPCASEQGCEEELGGTCTAREGESGPLFITLRADPANDFGYNCSFAGHEGHGGQEGDDLVRRCPADPQ